ncbi:MAG TPA: hypothetical protein VII30_03050 [Gemmatimonadaceae bacterium]
MPEYAKDVMIAVLGGSVALAGLLLVFLGFVFTQAAAFPSETTDDEKIARYRNAGRLGLLPFGVAIADAALVVLWLWKPCATMYGLALGVFAALLLATFVYGAVVVLWYL